MPGGGEDTNFLNETLGHPSPSSLQALSIWRLVPTPRPQRKPKCSVSDI